MKTIFPFCILLLIVLVDSGWRSRHRFKTTTWRQRQTTWWPRRPTTWPPTRGPPTWYPSTGPPTRRPTNRPTRRPATTRRWVTGPGGEIINDNEHPDNGCPHDGTYVYTRSGDRCYVLIQISKSFVDANKWCEDELWAYLASFHSLSEYDSLRSLVRQTTSTSTAWIGLNKRLNSDRWRFTDGTVFDWVPAKVGFGNSDTDECSVIDQDVDRLPDRRCNVRYHFICMRGAIDYTPTIHVPTTTTSPAEGMRCPAPGQRHGNKCYRLVNSPKNFRDAENWCSPNHLAAFHSKETYDFLKRLVRGSHVWTGANRGLELDSWMFTDGYPLDYFPRDADLDSPQTQDCLVISNNELRDFGCSATLPFICEQALTDVRDHCASNPCQHGGTCVSYTTTFWCECPNEWRGERCTEYCKKKMANCVISAQCCSGRCMPDIEMESYECRGDPEPNPRPQE